MEIPLIASVGALLTDGEDIKSKAFWVLGGLLIIVTVFESMGYTIGPLGQQVASAFPYVLAYIIGQKDAEVHRG